MMRPLSTTVAAAIAVACSFGFARLAHAQEEPDFGVETDSATTEAEEVRAAPTQAPQRREASPEAAAEAAADDMQRNQGWNKQTALLFSLHNIFQNTQFLTAYQGFGFGAQYHLSASDGVRIGLDVTRTSNPVREIRNTTVSGDQEVVEFDVNTTGPTSFYDVELGADYLKRLSANAFAPYVGAGLMFRYARTETEFEDDLTVSDQITTLDQENNTLDLGLQGVLGVAWRLHESFSLYAEYNLDVSVFRWDSFNRRETVERTDAGVETSSATRSEWETSRWLNFDTSLAQGATLGLIAFF